MVFVKGGSRTMITWLAPDRSDGPDQGRRGVYVRTCVHTDTDLERRQRGIKAQTPDSWRTCKESRAENEAALYGLLGGPPSQLRLVCAFCAFCAVMRAGAKTCAWSVSSSTSSSTSYGVWLLRYTRLHTKLAASSATDGLRSHGHRVAEWVLRGEGAQGFDDDEKGCASSSRSSIKGQLVHVCMYDMPRAADDYLTLLPSTCLGSALKR